MRKSKPKAPPPTVVTETGSAPGGEEATRDEQEPVTRGPEYYRGFEAGITEAARRRKDAEEDAAMEKRAAESGVSVVLGDGTITILDGMDRIVARQPMAGDWSRTLAKTLYARGFRVGDGKNLGVRISAHAMFSIRQMLKELEAQDEAKGAGPGMKVEDRPGRVWGQVL